MSPSPVPFTFAPLPNSGHNDRNNNNEKLGAARTQKKGVTVCRFIAYLTGSSSSKHPFIRPPSVKKCINNNNEDVRGVSAEPNP